MLCVTGAQKWKAVDKDGSQVELQWNAITQNIGANAENSEVVYFTAPSKSACIIL